MDAGYEELQISEACTEILRDWPKLDPAVQQSMLADYGIERLSLLALWALAYEEREGMLLLIRRHVRGRPVTEMTHVVIRKQDSTGFARRNLRDFPGPHSWGTMGWYE